MSPIHRNVDNRGRPDRRRSRVEPRDRRYHSASERPSRPALRSRSNYRERLRPKAPGRDQQNSEIVVPKNPREASESSASRQDRQSAPNRRSEDPPLSATEAQFE